MSLIAAILTVGTLRPILEYAYSPPNAPFKTLLKTCLILMWTLCLILLGWAIFDRKSFCRRVLGIGRRIDEEEKGLSERTILWWKMRIWKGRLDI